MRDEVTCERHGGMKAQGWVCGGDTDSIPLGGNMER